MEVNHEWHCSTELHWACEPYRGGRASYRATVALFPADDPTDQCLGDVALIWFVPYRRLVPGTGER